MTPAQLKEAQLNLAAARRFLLKLRRQLDCPYHKSTLRSVVFMLHSRINPRISFLDEKRTGGGTGRREP